MERQTAIFKRLDYCFLSLERKTDGITFRSTHQFPIQDILTIRCRMWQTRRETLQTDTCYARTRMGVDYRSFIWAIKEFRSLQPKEERTCILNPTLKGSQPLVLKLYLKRNLKGETFLNIEIKRNSVLSNHGIFSKISLLDSDGRVEHSQECYTNPFYVLGQPKFIDFLNFFEKDKLMSEQSSLLQDNVLYLRCEIQIGVDPVWNIIEKYAYLNLEEEEPNTPETSEMHLGKPDEPFVAGCNFKKAFEDWYVDKRLCDASLQSGTTVFRVHKNVLSARSPVFKEMFCVGTKLKRKKLFDIPDINADIISHMLLYIYKDTVEDLMRDSALDLYKAAIKYQLFGLREKCSLLLKSAFSVFNVCSIISVADLYEDGDLIKAAIKFISAHSNAVFGSDEWVNFKHANAQLALIVKERIIR